ncbi:MAG TPA: histidine kinase, partial [Actinomycetota bacterium]|nr:histidine kinase [Actinomycetota bacterium]
VLFPDGRPPTRWWWPVVIAVVALVAVDTAWFALTPFEPDMPGALARLSHPLGVEGRGDRFEDVFPALPLLYLALTLACIAALVHRLVITRGKTRLQVSWFSLGALAWVGAAVVDGITGFSERWVWAELVFISLPAIGATIGIVRHDLYDIRRVVRRGAVLLVLGAVAAAIYGTVVVLGHYWFGRPRDDLWSSTMAVALIAAAALPLLRAADRATRRLLYGDTTEPLTVLSRLTGELNAAHDPDALLQRAAEVIRASLRLPSVRIEPEGLPPVETGSDTTDVEVVPLIDRGIHVGDLALGRRAEAEPFRADERHLIDDLAARLASAVAAIRLGHELASSRERLVLAREEERRRIRNDLHDGLGPQLAGIALQLDLAAELRDRDPDEVERMLARAKAELGAAIVNVRNIVDGLRPPSLDELGLVGAIRQTTSALDASITNGFSVRVEADDPGPLPAAVEVAAFRIAAEAASNAARHSGASACTITLQRDDDLAVVVEDDGRGVDAGVPSGVGMTSMRQRAEELGGSLTVESGPERGTRIVARLPLP